MVCERCIAETKNGNRCKKTTCRQYPYCWIHLKSIDGLQVKRSTFPEFGQGLFATREHLRNTKLTHYSAKEVSNFRDPTSEYVLQIGKKRFINSKDPSNYVGRYINDSRGTNKQPNARFSRGYNITRKHNRHTVPIYSSKKINKGDELFISYGKQFFKQFFKQYLKENKTKK